MTIATKQRNKRMAFSGRTMALATFVFVAGCGEPIEAPVVTQFESGIYLLNSRGDKRTDGNTYTCLPMLMEMSVTEQSLTLGQRVFPCADHEASFDALTLQRSGSALLLHDEKVGTLLEKTLTIEIPGPARKIFWNLDDDEISYIESTATDEYRAVPRLMADDTPIAVDLDFQGTEDLPFKGFVYAARLPGAKVEFARASGPYEGELAYLDLPTGEFRLDPKPNFAHTDVFDYRAFGDSGFSLPARVTVSFKGTPDAPVAFDTYATTTEGSSMSFFADSYDPDLDPVTVEWVTTPKHGTLEKSANVFFYTPDLNYIGKDSFTYYVSDGVLKSNVAHFEITVVAKDDLPTVFDQDLQVTSESATPVTLEVFDPDSTVLFYQLESKAMKGTLVGEGRNRVYIPDPGIVQDVDSFSYRALSGNNWSDVATITLHISPGPHVSKLLQPDSLETMPLFPESTANSKLFFRAVDSFGESSLGATDGSATGTKIFHFPDMDNFGFDHTVGGLRGTTFFEMKSALYYTMIAKSFVVRLYRTYDDLNPILIHQIFPPGNEPMGEPSIGNVLTIENSVYLPISWPTTGLERICEITKIDDAPFQIYVAQTFAPTKGPCVGFSPFGAFHYIFVGSKLVKMLDMQGSSVVLKDLGEATPQPWMIPVGDKLFFQTRTPVGSNTRIDLWVTDGTPSGTKIIKEIETTFFDLDIFSPVAFANKLYFAHRKSLWSSDGTEAGTNIVATIPTNTVVGDGAIGTISAINGKLYFLATSDAAGREPWVSDGTAAGTQMLLDIFPGPKSSATPSVNRAYFQVWNGQVLFSANDGGSGYGLWKTDGTAAGTNLVTARPIVTIADIIGDKMIFLDEHYFYSMSLQ
jgi:ELWxxDGT repeat protein